MALTPEEALQQQQQQRALMQQQQQQQLAQLEQRYIQNYPQLEAKKAQMVQNEQLQQQQQYGDAIRAQKLAAQQKNAQAPAFAGPAPSSLPIPSIEQFAREKSDGEWGAQAPNFDQWATEKSQGWYGAQAPDINDYFTSADRARLNYLGDRIDEVGVGAARQYVNEELDFKRPEALNMANQFLDLREYAGAPPDSEGLAGYPQSDLSDVSFREFREMEEQPGGVQGRMDYDEYVRTTEYNNTMNTNELTQEPILTYEEWLANPIYPEIWSRNPEGAESY